MKAVGFGKRATLFADDRVDCSACGSVYEIEAGKQTDLLIHVKNSKILYVLSGQVFLTIVLNGTMRNVMLDVGQSIAVDPLTPHRMSVREDKAVVIEFGTEVGAYKPSSDGSMHALSDTRIIELGSQLDTSGILADSVVEESVEVAVEAKAETKPKRRRRRRKSSDDN